ncbi:hypothetical protein [Candidatus Methylacidithermus pantelleriae]|uniref:Uncharacterized protein n=1 Tax=Candidatus Methylacidithermus pantelleriae TaxID=2744239 RepID=A0A8J2FT31_9BACT|nr:hypothetical protein [Candidatus Methylacidithermus pantelleriae]CAF0700312.1 hypothetical protein MPNT_350008 [Candidatus Methylacidithermus pantelleriae]
MPVVSSNTLSDYVSQTRDYLNDPLGNFWTDQQIQKYVQLARRYVAMEGGTTLAFLDYATYGIPLPLRQETIPYPTVSIRGAVRQIMAVEDVGIIWGGISQPLRYMPWASYLSKRVINPTLFGSIPIWWTTVQEEQMIYIYPTSAISNTGLELRVRFWPLDLGPSGSDQDIVQPFQDLVPVVAAIVAAENQSEESKMKRLSLLYQTWYTNLVGRQSRWISRYL